MNPAPSVDNQFIEKQFTQQNIFHSISNLEFSKKAKRNQELLKKLIKMKTDKCKEAKEEKEAKYEL